MATIHQLLSAMQDMISQQLSDVVSVRGPMTVNVATEWPPMKVLQQNVKGNNALVSIFDRRRGIDATRWLPRIVSDTRINPLIMSSLTSPVPPCSLYIGGSIQPGDAVSLIASIPPTTVSTGVMTRTAAAVTSVTAASTTTTVAAALATAINGDALLSKFVSATASGNVVTLANLTAATVALTTNVGSVGSRVTEVGRRDRELQITAWTAYEEARMVVGDAIEALLAAIEVHRTPYEAGITFPDGTNGRLRMINDFYLDDAVLSGALRRDFLLRVDHPVTNVDKLYSVLAPVMQYSL